MRNLVRLFCWVAACAAMLGGAWAVARCERRALAAVDLPAAGHSLISAVHDGEALDARRRDLYERLQGKQEVVAALLDGRLSLREAGDEFHRLDAEKAEGEPTAQDAAGAADVRPDEAVYENLLAWINAAASENPQRGARAARLRAEVGSLLHRPLRGL